MAKITNKASLNVGTELTVNTATREITLNVAGNLVAKDGCSWQALYSKMIALWATSAYNDFPFPFYAIDVLSGQFQIGFDGSRYNSWTFAGDTRLYLRDGGWDEYIPTAPGADGTAVAGTLAAQYVGIVSLGNVSAGAQLYYQRTATAAPTNFTYDDEVNQGIQVYGDATHGNFDSRAFFKGFVREEGKKFKDSVLADTGKTATGAYIVNLLLANEDDLDVVAADAVVAGDAPYSDIVIRYFASAYTKDVDTAGMGRNFGIVIDVGTHSGVDGSMTLGGSTLTTAAAGIPIDGTYNGGTLVVHEGANKGSYTIGNIVAAGSVPITTTFPAAEAGSSFTLHRAVPVEATLQQVYTKVQWALRQNADIDATGGTVTGKTASLLLNFVGSRLDCGFYAPTNPNGGGSGVMVEGIADADINSIRFFDNAATQREYPYASMMALTFSPNLVSGGTGYFVLYYTDLSGAADWGTAAAVIVKDKNGDNIAGPITGAALTFAYDYTNETAGGLRTPGTDTGVTLVAGNPGVAKPVVTTGTITESKAITIPAVAEGDRSYA